MLDVKIAVSIDFKGFGGLSRMVLEEVLVPKAGLEPARISTVDFESTASTDFATSALKGMLIAGCIIPVADPGASIPPPCRV